MDVVDAGVGVDFYFCMVSPKRDVWKVRGLAAVRRCYAEGGGYLCQFVVVGIT
jgi:hypothetical protein